ncbi:MAG: ATP-binding cassette domain-containing protein, partial [Sneathiellaceae bacterium]
MVHRAQSAAPVEPLVSLSGLTVAFDDGRRHVPVLHGIDMQVLPGEAVGIVGESGCGKSVTWLAVLRLLGR